MTTTETTVSLTYDRNRPEQLLRCSVDGDHRLQGQGLADRGRRPGDELVVAADEVVDLAVVDLADLRALEEHVHLQCRCDRFTRRVGDGDRDRPVLVHHRVVGRRAEDGCEGGNRRLRRRGAGGRAVAGARLATAAGGCESDQENGGESWGNHLCAHAGIVLDERAIWKARADDYDVSAIARIRVLNVFWREMGPAGFEPATVGL